MAVKRSGTSRYFFYFFFAVGLIYLVYYGVHCALTKWEIFTIKSIEISGNVNLEDEFLENISADFIDKNLFATAKEDVLRKYENIIRISDIKVSRIIPNKLKITIFEKIGKYYIRTIEGDIFAIDKNREILDNNYFISEDLPLITSDISTDEITFGEIVDSDLLDRIINFETELREISPEFTRSISEYFIRADEIFMVESHIGFQIVLGEENLSEKIRYFFIVEQNRPFKDNTTIDLRYPDQLVIRTEGI